MSQELPRAFALACNSICQLAPTFPQNMPNYDDCLPGSYGTFTNGIWVKLGSISEFGVTFTVPDPGTYEGNSSWSSSKMATENVSLSGGVWVADDGAGSGELGVKFSDSSGTLFHVATSDRYITEISPDLLTTASGQVLQRTNWRDLRFVTRLIATSSYLSLGGVEKDASCVMTGDADALQDMVAGKVSGTVSVAMSNVTDLNVMLTPANQLVPVGMMLYEITKGNGAQLNIAPS